MTPESSREELDSRPSLISLVRKPGGITALLGRAGGELRPVALAALTRPVYPAKARLEAAWERLGQVRGADEETLYHLLLVLIESVPDLTAEKPPPLPAAWCAAPAAPKPTRAHPRAYRGTKHRPPKGGGPARIDVRPYLCDAGSLHTLLQPLRRFLPGAQARLRRDGYPRAVVEGIAGEFPRGADSPPGRSRNGWTLPVRFVEGLWRAIRWSEAAEVSAVLELYRTLELDHDARALLSVYQAIARDGAQRASRWCALGAALPPERRSAFLLALAAVEEAASDPAPATAEHLAEMHRLATDPQFSAWLVPFLATARQGLPLQYLLAGFRLAARFAPEHRFRAVGQCEEFPEETVAEIGDVLDPWLPLALWERCGQFPGMARIIGQAGWRALRPEAARRYFSLLAGWAYSDPPETSESATWESIRTHLLPLASLLRETAPPYQEKALAFFSAWLWEWETAAEMRRLIPAGMALCRRLAASAFAVQPVDTTALAHLLAADGQRLLAAPDSSFRAFETACRRDSDAKLIAYGLRTLAAQVAGFTFSAFDTAARRLLRAARLLGGMSGPVRAEVARELQAHPLFGLDPLSQPIREVCAGVWPYLSGPISDPLPARLKAWHRGEVQLPAGSLERYRRVVARNMVLTKLTVLEELALARLRQGLPVDAVEEGDRHALRLLRWVSSNRRGLRSFLHAWWSGDREYLARHPATLGWYREHPGICRAIWEAGVATESGSDWVTIRVERDPMEILRLGSYAGTCLAVGGLCSDSAIAVLLDANKKVLYARDRRGRVVGRQLVAIADDDRLVCFSVYPTSASAAVKYAFREYDRALASALGIPIFAPAKEEDAEYAIRVVLAECWWDDGNWDFEIT